MKLILALGNPGAQYAFTRHNFGWLVADAFVKINPDFSGWQENDRFKAALSEGQINNEKVILAKPQTFMNLSGQAAQALSDFYRLGGADIFVLHDDLALALGELRFSQNASAAGHNGVSSIIQALGFQNFNRLRLGIKTPPGFFAKFFHRQTPAEKFVVQKFSTAELKLAQTTADRAAQALKLALTQGLFAAQNEFN
ncbi:MAG: aminoacyl-tRNA hydrolase [Patescibacteria group bacterium]